MSSPSRSSQVELPQSAPAPAVPPRDPYLLSSSSVIAERYQLGEWLGRGSSATVFAATDLVLQRGVTVKLFDAAVSLEPALRTRFAQQAAKAATLQHAHIVRVLDAGFARDAGADHERPFVVTEPAGPHSLRWLLESEGRLSPQRAIRITRQIVSALDYAHRHGLVHADIKPENVLVDDRGEEARLVDFSLSFVAAQTGLVTPGTLARRAAYLAPEQVRAEPVDARTDVFAVGVLLFEMVAGRPPFVGPTPEITAERRVHEHAPPAGNYDPSIPPALDAVLAGALQRSPERRWASVGSFDAALAALDAARLAPVAVSIPARAAKPPHQRGRFGEVGLPSILPVAAGVGALLLALTVILPFLGSGPRLTAMVTPKANMPDLVGMSVADAQTLARSKGMEVHVVGERVSDRYPKGVIVQQSPVAGWQQAPEGPVRVTVSAGPSAPAPLVAPVAGDQIGAGAPESCLPGGPPQFVHGFAELKRQVGQPMGEPVECEQPGASGDIMQHTSMGLAYYNHRTNVAAFTDGWRHWALTDRGLVAWEGESPDPPIDR